MNALIRMARKYESFEDWPWALIYREMDDNFPNTKFILTRRKDADTWFKSLCNHAKKTGPSNFRKFVYGHKMPEAHQQRFVQRYLNHIDSVRAYFRNRSNDFLEVCWEEGDGWAQLADFLKVEAPDRAFPHANKSLSN